MLDYEESCSTLNYSQLATEFLFLKSEKERIKKEETAINKRFDTLTMKVIPDKMAEDGFQNVTLKGIGRIQLSKQAYCSVPAGMKFELFKWLKDNDFEELITEVVNSSTLKAFITEQSELGNDIPETIVNYQPFMRATVVKA